MVSQPQNPEFRINPENFHTCVFKQDKSGFSRQGLKVLTDVQAILSKILFSIVVRC